MMVEKLMHLDRTVAIVISPLFNEHGIGFHTPQDALLQVGSMSWPTGHEILPHNHAPLERVTRGTQEVLFILKGRLRADFYNQDNVVILQRELNAGEFICLLDGAHGFEVLEDVQMIEVKNGPYAGDMDKVRFKAKIK